MWKQETTIAKIWVSEIKCGNCKIYDIYKYWNLYWFYSKSKNYPWKFLTRKTFDSVISYIVENNDWFYWNEIPILYEKRENELS